MDAELQYYRSHLNTYLIYIHRHTETHRHINVHRHICTQTDVNRDTCMQNTQTGRYTNTDTNIQTNTQRHTKIDTQRCDTDTSKHTHTLSQVICSDLLMFIITLDSRYCCSHSS